MSLEDIYTKFNIDHPADFTGHSLSVSDVVVLHQDGENTSHYVDSVGYREIPGFTKELSVSAEISTEKDAVREETAEIPAEAAEEHTAAENTMAEPDNDKVSYYVIEDLSTWAENSPEKAGWSVLRAFRKQWRNSQSTGKGNGGQAGYGEGNFRLSCQWQRI